MAFLKPSCALSDSKCSVEDFYPVTVDIKLDIMRLALMTLTVGAEVIAISPRGEKM